VDWLRFWDYTAADWAGLQFAVLLTAAVVAYFQVREARRLRQERSRPFVVIEVDVRSGIAQFRIRNIGATLARDVRFEFDPPLKSTRDDDPNLPVLAELNLFTKGIPSLPPGMEEYILFDQLPARNATDLPDDYDVTVKYTDPLGTKFEETMTVGISHRREAVRLTLHDVHDVHRELKIIADHVKKWTVVGHAIR